MPFEADLHVPPNPELTRLVTSPEFIVFSERVKRDHQIAITPSPMFGQGEEAVFKFRCQRSNIDFLGTARDVLEDWLGQHNVSDSSARTHCDHADALRFRCTLPTPRSVSTILPTLSRTSTRSCLQVGKKLDHQSLRTCSPAPELPLISLTSKPCSRVQATRIQDSPDLSAYRQLAPLKYGKHPPHLHTIMLDQRPIAPSAIRTR